MKLNSFIVKIILCFVVITSLCRSEIMKTKWVEDTFEDFIDGNLDASGQNIYVRRDGTISTIHRYDINNDGYLDLFFGNTHDEQTVVSPVIAMIDKNKNVKSYELDILGSNHIQVSDLNRDGLSDLIFSLTNDGLQTSRRFLTIVYGDKEGWSSKKSGGLLTACNPLDIAIADINADGWPDVAIVNRAYTTTKYLPKENIRVYLGGSDGFKIDKFKDFNSPDARCIVSGDFNEDGFDDFATLSREGGVRIFLSCSSQQYAEPLAISLANDKCQYLSIVAVDCDLDGNVDLIIGTDKKRSYIIRGKKKNRWFTPAAFASLPASDIMATDLDGDSYSDLVLTYLGTGTASLASTSAADKGSSDNIHILWGGKDGFSDLNKTELAAKYAYATSAGDVDGDGNIDLAVAVYQSSEHFSAKSLLYFGSSKRNFKLSENTVPTCGATDVALVPAINGFSGAVVFSNSIDGTAYEKVPVYVYWGGIDGFKVETRWEIPGQSGHEASVADINADGFVDLLVTYTAHGGAMALNNPISGTNIFWGGVNGFDIENRRTILKKPWQDHCNVVDLNKDGYLDVVLGGWDPWLEPDKGKSAEIVIYYGCAGGVDPQKSVSIDSPGGSEGIVIADFNKDSWLDIAVTSGQADKIRIFWGDKEGFNIERQQNLYGAYPIGIKTADLNADGFLDIIVANYQDRINGFFDMGNIIFWGRADGFRQWDSQWLRGNCVEAPLVADLDSDGFLDIFFPSYHVQDRRDTIPSYIYWGEQAGFSERKRTSLICDSASGAFAGDFNKDGLIDLAVSCHTKYGNHKIDSMIFFNDANRFKNPDIQRLPTLGSHYMYVEDMGHIYSRKYQQRYESSVFEWNQESAKGVLGCEYEKPEGTNLIFYVRSAYDKERLKNEGWREVQSESDFLLNPKDRFLQYQILLISANGDRYPTVNKVIVQIS